MMRFIILCFLPLFSFGQDILQLKANNHNPLNFSLKEEFKYLEGVERCEEFYRRMDDEALQNHDKMSKKDKALHDECRADKEGYWDVVGIGCSWYCGGGPYEITASSELTQYNELRYKAVNAHDLDYKTAWVEGAEGDGVGEYLEYHFTPKSPRITKITIVNGYVKSESAWKNNSRVKKLKMYIDDTPRAILHLSDFRGEQSFEFEPIGTQEREIPSIIKASSNWVMKFEIMEIYPGDKYSDVAITEIYFDGIDVHCLAAGTQVTMADKTTKNIEYLTVGESVLSFNEESGRYESAKILELANPIHEDLVEVNFSDGSSIICTRDHPIKGSEGRWFSVDPEKTGFYYYYKDVRTLQVGKELFSGVFVTKIIELEGVQQTHTIVRLDNNNSFFANGILVGTEQLKNTFTHHLDCIKLRNSPIPR